jgi:hypothetical protein
MSSRNSAGVAAPGEARPDAQIAAVAGFEAEHDVTGHVRLRTRRKACLDHVHELLPGGHPAQLEGRLGPAASGCDQRPRGRVGAPHPAFAVQHHHAVSHLVDDEPIQLRFLTCSLQAAARRFLFPSKPGRQLGGQQRNHEQAERCQAGLGQGGRDVGGCGGNGSG